MRKDFLARSAKFLLSLLIGAAASSVIAFAQETPSGQDEDALPPLLTMSKNEQSQLSAETDFKRRTQLCLQLADARLQRAEQAANSEDFQNALAELGGYQAVLENGLKFLQRNNNDSGRIRDNFKRIEISLRTHAARLETIRRVTPFEYAVHLKKIMNFSRDARTRALNSFFSDTVLPEDSNEIAPQNAVLNDTDKGKNSLKTETKP